MNQFIKIRIEEALEDMLHQPVEDITFVCENDEMDVDVYLVSVEDGEEYWVLENQGVQGIFKYGGIYNSIERVIDAYAIENEAQQVETIDRSIYM